MPGSGGTRRRGGRPCPPVCARPCGFVGDGVLDVPFCTVLVLLCRGGRLCPPCMTAAPCRAGPVCPAGSNAHAAAGHMGPALQGRCADAVPYTFNSSGHKSPSKSQQFPAEFCAPIQNVKISPETVADGLRRCYIRPIHRKYTIYRHPWVSRFAAIGGKADSVFAKSNFT